MLSAKTLKLPHCKKSFRVTILAIILANTPTITSQDVAECGRNIVTDNVDSTVVGPRINAPDSGGEVVAGRGSWPWLASLGRFKDGEWRHYCGGSLVTTKHVLTAAHCLVPDVTAVRLGDGNLSDNVGVQRRIIRGSKEHPKYQGGKPYFDVAILTFSPPANIDGLYVRPICLPDSESDVIDEFDGDQMDIAGWGLTALNGLQSDVGLLRQVQQKVFRNSFCNASHAISTSPLIETQINDYLPNLFTSDLMCAGYEFGGRGSCQGDSGGPLMRYTYGDDGPVSARFVQQGIVQGGVGRCGSKDFPSIYVRIKDPEIFNFIQDSLVDPEQKRLQDLAKDLENAVRNNDTDAVSSILETNSESLDFVNLLVETENGYARTPLDYAIYLGLTEIVELLLKAGADPDVRDNYGYTATYGAAQEGKLEILKVLVEEGEADVNLHHGDKGNTVIMAAISRGKQDVVSYLIPRVKDINVQNYRDYTALYAATEYHQFQMVKELVLVGKADVNIKVGDPGWTAVMKAAYDGSLDILRFLIETGGADPKARNRLGQSLIDLALTNRHADVIGYLVTHTDIDVNEKNSEGETPIYVAAQSGFLDIVKILVEHTDTDINFKHPEDQSMPLTIASYKGFTEIVKYLLSHGAKTQVDYLNQNNISALYAAASQGKEDTVRILVEVGGANVELRNARRLWTALHLAAFNGNLKIVKFLVEEAGAEVTAKAGNGIDTPELLAEKNGHNDVHQYLKLAENSDRQSTEERTFSD